MLGRHLVSVPSQPSALSRGLGADREGFWLTSRRKQKMADRKRVTGFQRLYQALRSLQGEIEELMPDFEEQMDILV